MARGLTYYFNETGNSLRRNGLMALAAISTVFIALFLFGWALLIGREVNIVLDALTGKVEVAVYLQDTISTADRDRLLNSLNNMDEVQKVTYESKADAFERFKKIFADQPELTKNVGPNALPASFRVKLKDPEQFKVVSARLEGQPGVEQVVDQRKTLDRLFAMADVVRAGAFVGGIVMLLSALALIGNTIRVAVFSRRREIGIMRLVGATNWFIRIPFLIEGVVEGLIGAGAAIVALAILRRTFFHSLKESVPFLPVIGAGDLLFVIPILIVMGLLISFTASMIGMRRFLEV
ncbi:MAG: permease-like cell division protein FtsX [Actinomycetota bacterium]